MRILAIDLGTQCGFAVGCEGVMESHGAWDLKIKTAESPAMRPIKMRDRVLAQFQAASTAGQPIDVVWFEDIKQRPASAAAGHVYGELRGALMAACHDAGKPFTSITPGPWKKHLTGKGNAGKSAIMAAVRALGWHPETQDAADALGLLKYAMEVGA